MEESKDKPIYRQSDIDRVIAQFGNKPAEEIREKLKQELAWQKEKFLALERLRHRDQQRSRGRGR